MSGPSSEAQYLPVDASASGANALVVPAPGKRIRVLAFLLVGAGSVTARLQSTDDEDYAEHLTGPLPLAANAQIVASFNPLGWFETQPDEALTLHLSGSVAVGGSLVYVEV